MSIHSQVGMFDRNARISLVYADKSMFHAWGQDDLSVGVDLVGDDSTSWVNCNSSLSKRSNIIQVRTFGSWRTGVPKNDLRREL